MQKKSIDLTISATISNFMKEKTGLSHKAFKNMTTSINAFFKKTSLILTIISKISREAISNLQTQFSSLLKKHRMSPIYSKEVKEGFLQNGTLLLKEDLAHIKKNLMEWMSQ